MRQGPHQEVQNSTMQGAPLTGSEVSEASPLTTTRPPAAGGRAGGHHRFVAVLCGPGITAASRCRCPGHGMLASCLLGHDSCRQSTLPM